jgi:hypothetical protein
VVGNKRREEEKESRAFSMSSHFKRCIMPASGGGIALRAIVILPDYCHPSALVRKDE